MTFKIYCITAFLLSSMVCFSQGNKPIISPSPTAAGLGKYGDIPISNYTGIPNISVPLYTIAHNNLNLPISLNYHSSGVRVEEDASWCGLGFSVFAGGVITRSVRGVDDLDRSPNSIGYPQYAFPVSADENNFYVPPGNPHADLNYFRDVYGGLKDSEPDVFYFNFAGHSGKFFIQQRPSTSAPYVFLVESQKKLKISLVENGSGWRWTIQTDDGMKYIFSTEEKTKTYNGSNEGIESIPDNIPQDGNPKTVVSSWYLDEIVAQDGQTIYFSYTAPLTTGIRKTMNKSEERTYILGTQIIAQTPGCVPDNIPPHHNYISSVSVVYEVYLKEIFFPSGLIEFVLSDRDDMQPEITNGAFSKKLEKINIYSREVMGALKEIKSYEFNYGYFTNNDPYLSYVYGSYSYYYSKTYSSKRLKLLSLTEKCGDLAKPPYRFEYYTNSYLYGDIPDKYSKSRDHWGFFNNAWNVTIRDLQSTYEYISTMLPPYFDVIRQRYYNGADREPNDAYSNLGTLREIKYPTGGVTHFDYEGNDYSNFPAQFKYEKTRQNLLAIGNLVPADEVPTDSLTVSISAISITEPKVIEVSVSSHFSLDFCSHNNSGHGGSGSFSIRNTGSTPAFYRSIVPLLSCSNSRETKTFYELPPGTYELKVEAEDHVFTIAYVTSWDKLTSEPLLTKKGGGLRILRTVDYDGINHANDVIRRYQYTYSDGSNISRSSGKLMAPLNYEYQYEISGTKDCSGIGFGGAAYRTEYLHRSSSSNISMGSSAQGNAIGYSEVTVLYGENGENGKTVFNYKNNLEILSSSFYPNIPNQPRPENGLLEKQIDYKRISGAGNGFQKLTEVRKNYVSELGTRQSIKGFKLMGGDAIAQAQLLGIPYLPIIKFYDNISEWWHPVSDSTFTYHQNDENKFSVNTTQYFYENPNHYQLTKKVDLQSDGSELITKYSYPSDYNGINSLTIGAMKSDEKHMHNYIVEKVIQIKKGTDVKTVEAEFIAYKDSYGNEASGSSAIFPAKISTLDISTPKAAFTSSLATGTASDSDYSDKKLLFYDPGTNNIKEVLQKDGPPISYIWGYNGDYPIAEIKNAKHTDVYHTSFEETGEGNSTEKDAYSGRSSFIGTYTLPLSGLANGIYTLTYRKKTADRWAFIKIPKIEVSNNSYTIILSGQFDDIRFYPEWAMMTTYTYEPLVGITTITDAKGSTVYYEYDSFMRLMNIKDQHGNILKSYNYQYKATQ